MNSSKSYFKIAFPLCLQIRKYKSDERVRKKAEYLYNKLKSICLMQETSGSAEEKKGEENERGELTEQTGQPPCRKEFMCPYPFQKQASGIRPNKKKYQLIVWIFQNRRMRALLFTIYLFFLKMVA